MIRRIGPLRALRGCECTGLLVRFSALVGYPLVCFLFSLSIFFFFHALSLSSVRRASCVLMGFKNSLQFVIYVTATRIFFV